MSQLCFAAVPLCLPLTLCVSLSHLLSPPSPSPSSSLSPFLFLSSISMVGNLEELLDSDAGLSWFTRVNLAYDIARGMAYLHSRGVFHRDLTSKSKREKERERERERECVCVVICYNAKYVKNNNHCFDSDKYHNWKMTKALAYTFLLVHIHTLT